MKLFFSIMLFAICLLSLPSTSSGSNAPPGQCSFVADQPTIDSPVMVGTKIEAANHEFTSLRYQSFEMAELPREGGLFVVQDSNLELQATYKNDKNTFNATENTKLDNDDIRWCRYTKPIESSIKNIESKTRCTIRADSQKLV